MFNKEQGNDFLELDIYALSNKGPLEFELNGREKTVSGEDALQISTLSARQKNEYKRKTSGRFAGRDCTHC